jgi:hypothetical protein
VGEAGGLDEVGHVRRVGNHVAELCGIEPAHNGSPELCTLDGVRKPGAIKVDRINAYDLCLSLQAAKCVRVNDTVAIYLNLGAPVITAPSRGTHSSICAELLRHALDLAPRFNDAQE